MPNGIVGWGTPGYDGEINGFRTETNYKSGETGDGLVNYSWGADITRNGTVADGQWHHVAVTYDSTTSTKELYLNGGRWVPRRFSASP